MGNKSSRRQQQQAAGSSYPSNTDQYISNRDHYSNHHNASAPAITNPSHNHIESYVESIPVAYPVTSGPEIQAMPLNEMNRSNNNRVDSSWNDVARMIQLSNAEHNQRQQDSKHIIVRR